MKEAMPRRPCCKRVSRSHTSGQRVVGSAHSARIALRASHSADSRVVQRTSGLRTSIQLASRGAIVPAVRLRIKSVAGGNVSCPKAKEKGKRRAVLHFKLSASPLLLQNPGRSSAGRAATGALR